MKIIHIITGLKCGGAESQLDRLITDSSYTHIIVPLLSDQTPLHERFLANNISIYSPNFSYINPIMGIYRLTRFLKKEASSPNTLIQTWMYHGDFFGSLSAILANVKAPIIWNIRQTLFPSGLTGLVARGNALFSHYIPKVIVSCAYSALDNHIAHGYATKGYVIPNGYDTALFSPNPEAKRALRFDLNLSSTTLLVGVVGRYDPIKGHLPMLKTIASFTRSDVHFIFVGRDIASASPLQEYLQNPDIQKRVTVLPETPMIHTLMAGLDLLCLPSFNEGFPNVVAEAMSCGVPCLVTDVGDASRIVGETGVVVPSADPVHLMKGLQTVLSWSDLDWVTRSTQARQRIVSTYSIEKMRQLYFDLYTTVLEGKFTHENLAPDSQRQ